MTLQAQVMNALRPLGVPVAFQEYTGKSVPVWVTFFFYNQFPDEFADDSEIAIFNGVQIDVWARGDYSQTVEGIMAAMRKAGWRWSGNYDLYEQDTGIYHKVMRFNYSNSL